MNKHLFLIIGLLTLNLYAAPAPNVLFIAIDDMNDWVGFLDGHPQAKTPNLDRLAASGVNFRNAHCSAPACSPSRNALLFGVEPFNSGLYPFYDLERVEGEVLRKYKTLPQLFKENGYNTYGAGKIHHGADWSYSHGGASQWTENNYSARKRLPELKYEKAEGYVLGNSRKMAFCPTASPLEHHPDYCTAMYGVDVLRRQHERPFFLAIGFIKPHLPFVCPKPYFDLYPHPIVELMHSFVFRPDVANQVLLQLAHVLDRAHQVGIGLPKPLQLGRLLFPP